MSAPIRFVSFIITLIVGGAGLFKAVEYFWEKYKQFGPGWHSAAHGWFVLSPFKSVVLVAAAIGATCAVSSGFAFYVWAGSPVKKQKNTKFGMRFRAGMVSDLKKCDIAMWMAVSQSIKGQTLCPIVYLLDIQIVNLQNLPAKIEGYSVDVSDNEIGPWRELYPIPLMRTAAFMVQAPGHPSGVPLERGTYVIWNDYKPDVLKRCSPIKFNPTLDIELGKELAPGRTVHGFAAFEPKEWSTPAKYYRLTIMDSTGEKYSEISEIPRGRDTKTQNETDLPMIEIAGDIFDLSSLPIIPYHKHGL